MVNNHEKYYKSTRCNNIRDSNSDSPKSDYLQYL